jgi:hypothetical protein
MLWQAALSLVLLLLLLLLVLLLPCQGSNAGPERHVRGSTTEMLAVRDPGHQVTQRLQRWQRHRRNACGQAGTLPLLLLLLLLLLLVMVVMLLLFLLCPMQLLLLPRQPLLALPILRKIWSLWPGRPDQWRSRVGVVHQQRCGVQVGKVAGHSREGCVPQPPIRLEGEVHLPVQQHQAPRPRLPRQPG